MNKRDKMYQRIERHGNDLLAIFPDALEHDPVKLCKKLRRLESRGHLLSEAYCNGEIVTDYYSDQLRGIVDKARKLLNSTRPIFNGDPRGYALKIDLMPGESLHRDMGGYGIIAPDLS